MFVFVEGFYGDAVSGNQINSENSSKDPVYRYVHVHCINLDLAWNLVVFPRVVDDATAEISSRTGNGGMEATAVCRPTQSRQAGTRVRPRVRPRVPVLESRVLHIYIYVMCPYTCLHDVYPCHVSYPCMYPWVYT